MTADQSKGTLETPAETRPEREAVLQPDMADQGLAAEGIEATAAAQEEPVADGAATEAASADPAAAAEEAAVSKERVQALEQEGEIAADYLEELLDIVDMDGDLDLDVEGDRAVVAIVGRKLDKLIGSKGEVLDALQELTRLAVHQQTGIRSRLMLDVGGHRAQRRRELTELAEDVARRVVQNGQAESLAPMTPFERKVVHDAVTAVAGVRTESEGEEPDRRVVVLPC